MAISLKLNSFIVKHNNSKLILCGLKKKYTGKKALTFSAKVVPPDSYFVRYVDDETIQIFLAEQTVDTQIYAVNNNYYVLENGQYVNKGPLSRKEIKEILRKQEAYNTFANIQIEEESIHNHEYWPLQINDKVYTRVPALDNIAESFRIEYLNDKNNWTKINPSNIIWLNDSSSSRVYIPTTGKMLFRTIYIMKSNNALIKNKYRIRYYSNFTPDDAIGHTCHKLTEEILCTDHDIYNCATISQYMDPGNHKIDNIPDIDDMTALYLTFKPY